MIRLLAPGIPALVGSGKLALLSGVTIIAPAPGGRASSISLLDFVSSYASAYPIVQRKAGTTYADVPVLYGFSGTAPTTVQARVVKASGGAVVVDWTDLTSQVNSTATGKGKLANVPQGGWYKIQVRTQDSTDAYMVSNGSMSWGVGVVFLMGGQSNMVQTLNGPPYTHTVPGAGTDEYSYYNAGNVPYGMVFDDAGWHVPSNGGRGPTGSSNASTVNGVLYFLRTVTAALKAKAGIDIPVGVVPWAWNGTSIDSFVPGGAYYANLFGNSGSTAGAIGFASPGNVYAGDFEGVLWHQGEADTNNSIATYKGKLSTLYQGYLTYVANFGRTAANLFFGVAVLGNYSDPSTYSIENIRAAELQFAADKNGGAWPKVQVGWTSIDLWRGSTNPLTTSPPTAPNDTFHFGSASQQTRSMQRCVQTVLAWLGASGNGPNGAQFSGMGPSLGTVSRSGLVATFSVVHEGGNALVVGSGSTGLPAAGGTAPTGFLANTAADFTGTNITVTAALVNSNTQIALTFPGGTTFPVYVKYMGGKVGNTAQDSNGFTGSAYPDIRNPIYDNVVYPSGYASSIVSGDKDTLGLPLLPTVSAITVT